MNINFIVKLAQGLIAPVDAPRVSVEANYLRTFADSEGESNEPVPQAVRIALDAEMKGAATLESAATTSVVANVLAVDGSVVMSRTLDASADGTATLELRKEDVEALAGGKQAVPTDVVPPAYTRTVRLIATNDQRIDYAGSSVMVSPVKEQASLAAPDLQALLAAEEKKISSVEVTGRDLQPLTAIAWIPTHVAIDGTFTCAFKQQQAIGWLWWLNGTQQVLGFVPDDLSVAGDRRLAIALPALAAPPPGQPATDDSCCGRTVRADVSEAELANNPGVYSEDPGAFCKPFTNPERVLSEKAFSVIARITTPEIGATGSSRTKSVGLLDLETLERPSNGRSSGSGFLARLTGGAARTPVLVRAAIPTRHVLPEAYQRFVNRLPSVRSTMDARHPLQWEDDIAQYQAATVALGHILEFRIRWRSNGYSLGTVAKTLTLAPRQTKRIQKIEWQRTEGARRSERTQLTDIENDSVTRERDYQDQVSASLDEWARGSSHSDTEAIAGGIGFLVGGVLGGVGGGAGSSNSSSTQEGGRDTTASEHQRLRDAIRRHGDALRKFESTVVNEVTEEETVTGTTEVVRNLNYAHALTVIYYQILRHLKVNTEFGGVRECLFVPFAIKPFDTQRAYRWREAIQVAIRSRLYLRALRYLKDVATNFATSDIPPGTRAEQQLTYLRGSIFIDLAIERPKDSADGKYDDATWNVIKQLVGVPTLGIYAQLLVQSEADRDRYYQANFAPHVAAKWANRLQLKIAGTTVTVDATLATRYQFNRGVRIDFVAPLEQLAGLRRTDLQTVTVLPMNDLPAGSVANLTRMSITYSTARFERSVAARTGINDLLDPETGRRDQAMVSIPLDSWESVNERLEITRSVNDLVEHLNEHVEYYHKAIWWHMDRDRLMMMLDGFYVPNTNNVSIATVVDREPIGIIGNCLVYRVGVASYIGYGKIKTPQDLYNLYAEKGPVRDPVLVSLPTDGLYAQTIMDECLALEEHYGNLDWALSDKDPDLGVIDPSLLTSRRADLTPATTPTPLPATIINLQNAPEAPAPAGLQGVLNAVTTSGAFRDMAGLAATQANAQAALNTAAGLATNFGNQAAALELAKIAKADQATKSADQKLASIKSAVDKGLSTPAEGAQAARETLSAMNPDAPKTPAPHEDPVINAFIANARRSPGSTIEASTEAGAVKVALGSSGGVLSGAGQPIRQQCGFFGATVMVTEADLRDGVRSRAEAERTNWDDGAGNRLMEDNHGQFGHLVRYWLCRTGDIRPDTLVELQQAAINPGQDYGVLVDPAAAVAPVNADIVRVRGELLTGVSGAGVPGLDQLVEGALRDARTSGITLPANKRQAWSAVFVVATIRSAGITLELESESSGAHVGKNGLLLAHPGHRGYVIEADRRRKAGITGTYHAFAVSERVLQVGDIIVQDRAANTMANVWQFANIPALAGGREMHCDIVISVDAAGGNAVAIGGNVGQSVRRRRYPLAADGHLIVDRTQLYTQENDAGTLPAVPAVTAAAGLNGVSTGRIFAVLSPVQECVLLPGQEVGTGLVA